MKSNFIRPMLICVLCIAISFYESCSKNSPDQSIPTTTIPPKDTSTNTGTGTGGSTTLGATKMIPVTDVVMLLDPNTGVLVSFAAQNAGKTVAKLGTATPATVAVEFFNASTVTAVATTSGYDLPYANISPYGTVLTDTAGKVYWNLHNPDKTKNLQTDLKQIIFVLQKENNIYGSGIPQAWNAPSGTDFTKLPDMVKKGSNSIILLNY